FAMTSRGMVPRGNPLSPMITISTVAELISQGVRLRMEPSATMARSTSEFWIAKVMRSTQATSGPGSGAGLSWTQPSARRVASRAIISDHDTRNGGAGEARRLPHLARGGVDRGGHVLQRGLQVLARLAGMDEAAAEHGLALGGIVLEPADLRRQLDPRPQPQGQLQRVADQVRLGAQQADAVQADVPHRDLDRLFGALDLAGNDEPDPTRLATGRHGNLELRHAYPPHENLPISTRIAAHLASKKEFSGGNPPPAMGTGKSERPAPQARKRRIAPSVRSPMPKSAQVAGSGVP